LITSSTDNAAAATDGTPAVPDAADTADTPRRTGHAGLVHLPGLDGLRGIAVLAVVVYHAWDGVLPGGFLGVDLFFVLSGFLITGLLLAEHRGSGRVNLGTFWARRFRRLLPALLVFLVGVATASALLADPTTLRAIRADGLAALAYVANWWFVISGQSYADAFSAPSPLTHLWSLSVEEQYYLLWPLVVAAVMGLGMAAHRRRAHQQGRAHRIGKHRLLVLSSVALVASTAWMAVLSIRGAAVDRLYFGTDTRAATILAGVVLAVVLEPVLAARAAGTGDEVGPRTRRAVALAGVLGAAVLLFGALTADHRDTWLHRGGFTLMAIAATAVIAAVVLHPRVDRGLGTRPLRWAGTRSYGIYLWHWLVLVVLIWQFPAFTGAPRLLVVLVVTGLIAELSYRVVERPIRTGAWHLPAPRVLVPSAIGLTALVLVAATAGQQATPDYLRPRRLSDVQVVEPPPTTAPEPTSTPSTMAATPAPEPAAPTTAPPPVGPPPGRIVLVGDSVAASLSTALGTAVGRQGAAFANSAFPGCGVLEGDPADPQGRPLEMTAACGAAVPRKQREVVDRVRPDLVMAFSSWEARDRSLNGQWAPWATAESDNRILDLYHRTIDRLTARGARVALVTVPDPIDSRIGPVDDDLVRRHRHLNELLAEVARRDPYRVTLVHLDDIVCPADPCPPAVDGVPLRPQDGTHFDDPAAAKLVADRLAERVMRVPAGTR